MKPGSPDARPESLLEHGPFVRRIARSLLFDEHRVDDVVQETWLAALERPPRTALRAWLGTVVRNFSLRSLRGEGRRVRREVAAARPEAVPSTEEIVARESARRSVVEAVLALEEPFRSAILLRFYEGLPPRSLARRLGIPVETARSRVKRGVEMLRARLDGAHRDGRRAWSLALVPLALPRPAEAAGLLALGSIAMSTASKIGISAALLLGGYFLVRPESGAPPREERTGARPAVAAAADPEVPAAGETAGPPSGPRLDAAPSLARVPVGTEAPPEPVRAAPSPEVRQGVVAGYVTDGAGTPVEGGRVELSIPTRRLNAEGKEEFHFGQDNFNATTTTDAAGRYRFELKKGGRIQFFVGKQGFERSHAYRDVGDPPLRGAV